MRNYFNWAQFWTKTIKRIGISHWAKGEVIFNLTISKVVVPRFQEYSYQILEKIRVNLSISITDRQTDRAQIHIDSYFIDLRQYLDLFSQWSEATHPFKCEIIVRYHIESTGVTFYEL